MNNLEIDSLLSSGELEQLIGENQKYSVPEILSTERPDKATKYLYGGRVVVLINGNPYALIMPATLIDFISSSEDSNLKFQFGNFSKYYYFIHPMIILILSLLIPNIHDYPYFNILLVLFITHILSFIIIQLKKNNKRWII